MDPIELPLAETEYACDRPQCVFSAFEDSLPEDWGRHHMISFQSLMQAGGYYTLGYLDIIETLRRISDKPTIGTPAFYRQMVFNTLIGNTDDHLKDFTLLNDDSSYFLSPAYDLLSDTADRREHVLHFSSQSHFPGK